MRSARRWFTLLPLAEGEVNHALILALPEDQATWSELELMFATPHWQRGAATAWAYLRDHHRNGKIAMKL